MPGSFCSTNKLWLPAWIIPEVQMQKYLGPGSENLRVQISSFYNAFNWSISLLTQAQPQVNSFLLVIGSGYTPLKRWVQFYPALQNDCREIWQEWKYQNTKSVLLSVYELVSTVWFVFPPRHQLQSSLSAVITQPQQTDEPCGPEPEIFLFCFTSIIWANRYSLGNRYGSSTSNLQSKNDKVLWNTECLLSGMNVEHLLFTVYC